MCIPQFKVVYFLFGSMTEKGWAGGVGFKAQNSEVSTKLEAIFRIGNDNHPCF